MLDAYAGALDLHRNGRLEEAAFAYEHVLDAEPQHFGALYYLSLVRGIQGRAEEALVLAVRAAGAVPGAARAHAQAGALLTIMHRHDEALGFLNRAIALDPEQADVANNVGAALRALGRRDEARTWFERALSLKPGYRDALRNLANVLSADERYDKAVGFLQQLVDGACESAAIYDELGKALWKTGRVEEAEAALRRAIELDAGFADAWGHLGNMLLEEGRMDEAEQALREAVERAANRPEFYGFLAAANGAAITSAHVAALERLAATELPAADRTDVHYALARIAEYAGDSRRAFEHVTSSNAERRKVLTYDEAVTLRSFEEIAAVFSASFLQARAERGCPDASPIFIFGMPRSGTTLIEQVLASHPLVHGAGELSVFESIVNDVLGPHEASATPLFTTDAHALAAIGERYVAAVKALAPSGVQRVTDKMPDNFKYAGLIHLALPNARMIHACRDPIDTCISCFSTAFASDGLAWSYDLRETGRRYRGYRHLMEHWWAALPPGAMLEVRYEDMVSNIESQARRILAYCGLPWDDRVLAFHRTQRPVRTASATQVRKPIYRNAIGKARDIEDLLSPLREALGNAAAPWPPRDP
jgi:tetratricopeptide (TPR) repeat protein